MFLPHPRVTVSIVGSLRSREVACSASDRQGSNFESCVWRTVSSHHPQEVLLAQFSLYVHKGGLKPDSFYFLLSGTTKSINIMRGDRKQRLYCCTKPKCSIRLLFKSADTAFCLRRWPNIKPTSDQCIVCFEKLPDQKTLGLLGSYIYAFKANLKTFFYEINTIVCRRYSMLSESNSLIYFS